MSEKKKPFLAHEGHGKPITRRDFLAQGAIAYSATTLLPSLAGLLRESAFANECGPAGGKAYIPFLVIDAVGGAALPANFLVGKKGGPKDLLKSYDRLGWDPRAAGALDESLGLPGMMAGGILTGIRNVASPAARANLRLGSLCHFAQDDSSSNPLSAVALVAKAGYRGSVIGRGLGSRNTISGGNSQAAAEDPAMKALFVSSVDDIKNAIGLNSAAPFAKMTPDDLKRLVGTTAALTTDQARRFETSEKGKAFSRIARCAADENVRLVNSAVSVDPRTNPLFKELYQLEEGALATQREAVTASLMMNLIGGQTGPATIAIGGCDYHDNTSTTGDSKDLEIGVEIGRAIEAAHRLKKPLFFQLLTDGGCNNRQGSRIWVSDAGDRSLSVIGYYDPNGAPAQRRLQIGSYTDGQAIDRNSVIGMSPFKAACAVFANYLKLSVKPSDFETEFDRIIPRGTFKDIAEVESLLIFG